MIKTNEFDKFFDDEIEGIQNLDKLKKIGKFIKPDAFEKMINNAKAEEEDFEKSQGKSGLSNERNDEYNKLIDEHRASKTHNEIKR